MQLCRNVPERTLRPDAQRQECRVGPGQRPQQRILQRRIQRYSTLWIDSPGSLCSSASRALCR
jgi:hypothetical protein